jgi:hypothetical protein
MADESFLIQRPVEAKEFYDDNIAVALAKCQKNATPLFMNELLLARTNAPKGSRLWQVWYTAPSVRATGTTSKGAKVVVYAHRENYFSYPKNIAKARKQGLDNYAGKMPQEAFQALIDLDEEKDQSGNRLVWVINYNTLKKAKSDSISVDQALEHPQTIPFCGGEAQAKEYLKKHEENYGKKIGNWHSDDLRDDGPLGRLLYVGDDDYGGLDGLNILSGCGRFVGVLKSAEGTQRKIVRPTSDQIMKVVGEYTPAKLHPELEARIKGMLQ